VNFLIDMPLSPHLAAWLEARGHDAVHALHVGLDRAPDERLLQYALEQGRVVITADLDFPRLMALARAAAPGIILVRGGANTEEEVARRLQRALERVPEAELTRSIVVLEKNRIRRRLLPLAVDPGERLH
jgi:predicted nuclease of predicted toxin-antitoxin system